MKKKIENYVVKYGDVSKNFIQRFIDIIDDKSVKDKEIVKLRKRINKLRLMKWNTVKIVIYLEPQATPRPRLGRFGTFYVKGSYDNGKLFGKFMEGIDSLDLITTACKFKTDVFMPMPSNMNRLDSVLAELKMIRPLTKPDWDNLGKTYSDMVQKHLLLEDSLVIEGIVRKYYSSKPRVEITIDYQEKYDSKYNKRKVESWKAYKESGTTEIESAE